MICGSVFALIDFPLEEELRKKVPFDVLSLAQQQGFGLALVRMDKSKPRLSICRGSRHSCEVS